MWDESTQTLLRSAWPGVSSVASRCCLETSLLKNAFKFQVRDSEQSHRSRSSPAPQDRVPHKHRDRSRSRSTSRSPQRRSSKKNSEQSGCRGSRSPSRHSKQWVWWTWVVSTNQNPSIFFISFYHLGVVASLLLSPGCKGESCAVIQEPRNSWGVHAVCNCAFIWDPPL